jgi:SAM-dependent methyltransferase
MAEQPVLSIMSPKRDRRLQNGWEGFFPYYAGYPERFALKILESAELSSDAIVLDPWNGSGTTVFAASQLGLRGIGLDINPAMVIIARARLLPPTEADSLVPLGLKILEASRDNEEIGTADPLLTWFDLPTARIVRSIERAISSHMVGGLCLTSGGLVERMTHFAAAFYVSLFSVCRKLASRFYSSNPTWMRLRRSDERRVRSSRASIEKYFSTQLKSMSLALSERSTAHEMGFSEIRLENSTNPVFLEQSIDLVLSSPPYCTRIDYTSATRIELAVIEPLISQNVQELSRSMLGSVRVPVSKIEIQSDWGVTCAALLHKIKNHSSKASSGYYYKTHLDYFEKLFKSIHEISRALKSGGRAVFVVQDSFYKEVHNDLPSIFSEMAQNKNLRPVRREDFYVARSMSSINRNAKLYNRRSGAVESVLCFEKT